MASKNFTGYLRDPLTEYAANDLWRFTHLTTTGEVILGSQSLHKVDATGFYDIDIQYGNVVIESRDATSQRWMNHGMKTINSETIVTTLPALLLATTPVTPEIILQLEALLTDAETAAASAEASAELSLLYAADSAESAASIILRAVALALNTPIETVIDASNTTDALGPFLYMHDRINQKTWAKPGNVGANETIISVSEQGVLTTNTTATYQLLTLMQITSRNGRVTFKSDSHGSAVENMINYMVDGVIAGTHEIGNTYSTGETQWMCGAFGLADPGIMLSGGVMATSLNGVFAADYALANDGGVTDDTAKLNLAIEHSLLAGHVLHTPPFSIGVTEIVIENVADQIIDFMWNSNETRLVGLAAEYTESLLKLVDWVQSAITGALEIAGSDNYYQGLDTVSARTGFSKNAFYNIRVLWCEVALRIGRSDNNLLNSENTYYNFTQFGCATAVRCGGAQSGAIFSGGVLLGVPMASKPTAPVHAIWAEGGFWAVVGGEVVTSQGAQNSCIRINPCSVDSGYAQVRIVGGIMESASVFAVIDNPESIVLDNPASGQLIVTGTGGYCGSSAIINSNWIDSAADFAGLIQLKSNHFYAAVQRNAFNINAANENCIIELDKSSFGSNFRDWIGGCNGGRLRHDNLPGAGAFNANPKTYAVGVVTPVLYSALYNKAQHIRYNAAYNITTGIFTVPAGGLEGLTVNAAFLASATATATLTVDVDGVTVAFGTVVGRVGAINAVIEGLTAGQEVAININPEGSPIVMTNGKFNYISFTISN